MSIPLSSIEGGYPGPQTSMPSLKVIISGTDPTLVVARLFVEYMNTSQSWKVWQGVCESLAYSPSEVVQSSVPLIAGVGGMLLGFFLGFLAGRITIRRDDTRRPQVRRSHDGQSSRNFSIAWFRIPARYLCSIISGL